MGSPELPKEAQKAKLMDKLMAEPLVPIGCAVTAGVLVGGIVSFHKGNVRMSQKMMRARVLAQGATLAALAYGAYLSSLSRKKFDDSTYQGNLPAVADAKDRN